MSVRVMTLVWAIDLPASQKIVLLALADCANDEGLAWPGMASLSRKCSKSERTVQTMLAELEVAGHITREQVPGCLHGRITTLLDNGELERAAGLRLEPAHSRLMICGNPQMIDDTRARLKQRGLQLSLNRRPGQVAVENYW